MKVLNSKVFCLTDRGDLGIATEHGTFAASAWCISDEAFSSVRGSSFSWIGPDGGDYTDSRAIFSRPSESQIIKKLTPRLKEIAIEKGYISE